MVSLINPAAPTSPEHTVTLRVPDLLYEHVQRAAAALKRPLEEILLEALATLLPLLAGLPDEVADDLSSLPFLNDAALFEAMRTPFPTATHEATSALLERKGRGELTAAEQQRLDALVHDHEQFALRRAQAALLLQRRGYDVSDPSAPNPLP